MTPEQKASIEAAIPGKAVAKPAKPRKILLCHMTRRNGKAVNGHGSIAWANYALELMGKRTGAFTITIGNEESDFTAANLKQYDAIIFNNTLGILLEDPEKREALLAFVREGKGFLGFHGAAATFVQHPKYDQFPEFGVMLGGYEDGGHPWEPRDTTYVKIDDPKSPLTAMFKGPFTVSDEAFQFREPTLRDRLHVLLSIDADKVEKGPGHRILPQRQKDMDFPISWVKPYGKGRVFYTTLGHNPQIFTDPVLLQHFLAGIQFATGDLKAPMAPVSTK
ncbi:MAG: ThuA domain-containing protein [Bryobacteraceae bacterium]|nr:ThuA domain-containing protein [Bryobacteraceae bacterium]